MTARSGSCLQHLPGKLGMPKLGLPNALLRRIEEQLVTPFWRDPQCGDGTCEQPFEFPAWGRFGCRRAVPSWLLRCKRRGCPRAGCCAALAQANAVMSCTLSCCVQHHANSPCLILANRPAHAHPTQTPLSCRADCGLDANTTRILVKASAHEERCLPHHIPHACRVMGAPQYHVWRFHAKALYQSWCMSMPPPAWHLAMQVSSNFAGHPLLAPRLLMSAARWNLCLLDAARRQRGDPDLCW